MLESEQEHCPLLALQVHLDTAAAAAAVDVGVVAER